ncbi:MAG TPA: hypothetical protein VFZ53_05265 [Polyangiaceae bacterium]
MTRQVFALGAVFILASACGGYSTRSQGDGEPAAGKGGETATGGASNGGSASGGVSGSGSSSGGVSGSGGEPPECSSFKDCPVMGAPCTPCPDGSLRCAGYQCVRGVCLPGSVQCPECQGDSECPVPPLQCGTCADGAESCPLPVCYEGECTVGWSGGCPGVLPCANLACGASCNPCTFPDCPPPEVLHFCNWKGECEPEPGRCGEQCDGTSDCPPPPPSCGDCPGDTCLAAACVNGVCEFVCH